MTACAFCGRENTADSRFCMDCGKPISSSAARAAHGADTVILCPKCGRNVAPGSPFCGKCGARVVLGNEPGECGDCGATYVKGVDLFCARCGHRVGQRVSVGLPANAGPTGARPRLALLSDTGEVAQTFTLDRGEAVIGRGDADIRFEHDHYMSPLHARIDLREGQLWVRDLGSRNGTWIFVDKATRLCDGDLMLVGSQLLRFRRLGYPGPHPPEADSTRRMGSSVPSVDIAVIEQLRADGSVRDMFHLSPGRSIGIGRDVGDWIFPYDQTMSGRHAELKSEDTEFFLQDAGSRNGVAMATRGERTLAVGQRLLVGDQVLRIESV
jgi:pSer/pThr/pTyr-binding forkhead associated (FHA) protein